MGPLCYAGAAGEEIGGCMKETDILKLIQIEASKRGYRLFRNNCGNLQDKNGMWVKYGVANPGGSDLIGWKPVFITPDMVGKVVAVFTAIEVKSPKGRMDKEGNQQHFLDAVNAAGGIGKCVRDVREI